MIRKPWLIFIGFLTSAILTLTVGIFGAHHVFRQSEIFRQVADTLSRQTPEQISPQLIQYAFEAEIACKNVAAAALLASLLVLIIGVCFAWREKSTR